MTDPYGFLFRRVLQPAWESGVRRRPTLERLESLWRSQWYSAAELEALQLKELRRLLDHAQANVPFYRRRFAELDLRASDVRALGDLWRLPVLSRDEAALSLSERLSSAPPLPTIRKMTSGTTGQPLEIAYDADSEHWRNAVKLRGYGWAHYQPGDRSLHFWGNLAALHEMPLGHQVKVKLDHALRREHFFDCTDRSDEALARVVEALVSLRPSALVCYAQAGAALARYVVENRLELPKPLAVICAAERLFPADREVMQRAFGPDVFETYGSREVMLIAAECDAHRGMHLSMENLVVEVIVREGERSRPAEPGETGEVAVTDLHNYGAPFIRYLTGDRATLLPPGRCACGRGLARLASVEGRVADTLHDGQGRAVSGLFFNVMFSVMADRVREFQVVQRRDGSIDLSLVPAARFDDGVVSLVREKCAEFLPGAPLRIHVVSHIPVAAGGKLHVVRVESS